MFILFIIVLFPLIDLLYLGAAYGIAWYLNHLEVRELSVRLPAEAATVLTEVDTEFFQLGLARFIDLQAATVMHPGGARFDLAGNPPTVSLLTRVNIRPLLNVPFFPSVPGISARVTFDVQSTRVQEELGQN